MIHDFGSLEQRTSDVFRNLAPDFAEYVRFANWNKDHATRYGPHHDRFELHVHAYAKAMQLVRHHYFKEIDWQRQISFYEAIDLFANDGYEIGFNEHWMKGMTRNCLTFNGILYAPSIEAAHVFIGDYEPLAPDGRKLRKTTDTADEPVSVPLSRAA